MSVIGVIGAGLSGVVVCKELLEGGLDVVCFEASGAIGGVFASSYEELKLTTSSVNMQFSDFTQDLNPTIYWTATQYLEYLQKYADKFGVTEKIRFNSEVVRAVHTKNKGWTLTIRSKSTTEGKEEPSERDVHVSRLVVCAGIHQRWSLPELVGQETFGGHIIHSSEWKGREDERTKGKRVLIVGGGESASDIFEHVAETSEFAAISWRNIPGCFIPRLIADEASDVDTCRMTNALSRPFHKILTDNRWVRAKWLFAPILKDPVLAQICSWNMEYGTNPHMTFATKTAGAARAVLNHGGMVVKGITKISGSQVDFDCGATYDFDTIVCATGFEHSFPFFEGLSSSNLNSLSNPRSLYHYCVHPDLGLDLFLCGYARPSIGNIPTASELQARWYTLLVTGRMSLPSTLQMKNAISDEISYMHGQFGHNALQIPTLMDFSRYTDGLATEIGCMPSINYFQDFKTAHRILNGPVCGTQFRICGPQAKPELALKNLHSMQYSPWLDNKMLMFVNILLYFILPPLPRDPLKPMGHIGNVVCRGRNLFQRFFVIPFLLLIFGRMLYRFLF